jgi:tetratricopeptide (TPR) repeat protein
MSDQDRSPSRLEMLKIMVAQNPGNSFVRYGLAMEYRRSGELEAALAEFRSLLAADPNYVPAYFHGGQTLERLGRADDAREIYKKGVEAAARAGDQHARGEIEAALAMLG